MSPTTTPTRYPGGLSATEVATWATRHVPCRECSAMAGADCAGNRPGWTHRVRFADACQQLNILYGEVRTPPPAPAPSLVEVRRLRVQLAAAQPEVRRLRQQLAEARAHTPGDEFLAGLDSRVYGLLKLALGTDEQAEAQAAFEKARTLKRQD